MFRQNKPGQIYGVTSIDQKQKVVFNGSPLGKAFSCNIFQEKFNNQKQTIEVITSTEQGQSINQNNSTSSIGNLSGLPGIENGGENPGRRSFIRRMKRRNRRRFKR